MNKKKILYVIHRSWPYLGGAERHFFEWAKSSRDQGYDVTIFTTDVWDIEYFHNRSKRRVDILEEVVDGIKIKRFRVVSFSMPVQLGIGKVLSAIPSRFFNYAFGYPHIYLPGYLWKMAFMRERFDLVHAGVFPHLFLIYPATEYGRKLRIPVVCTTLIHSGEPHSAEGATHFLGSRQIELLKSCTKITTNTGFEKELLVSKGIYQEDIRVIGPGAYPEEVWGGNGGRFRKEYGIKGKIVLQISTQTHDKGSPHLVEAMKQLWNRGTDVTLVLIGQVMGDFDTYFFSQPPWVYERVIVLDYINEQTKKDALDACDIFVMPSKADSFGIVYLEAWLYKKPVIGAYAGGIPKVIREGIDGFLVPFADVHMLSEYIRLLLAHPPLANALGHNGYLRVLREYTWEMSCKKLQRLYDELLT
jgi:glycosyltransferase involved in cell wall biosynthesis